MSININEFQNEDTFYTDRMDCRFIYFFNDDEQGILQKGDLLSTNIAMCGSTRLRNCLLRASKPLLSDVLFMTKAQILKIKNFGRKSFEELFDLTRALLDGKELTKPNSHGFKNPVDKLHCDGDNFRYKQVKDLYLKNVNMVQDLNDKEYPEKSLGWYLCAVHQSLQRDFAVLQNLSDDSICSEYKSHKKDFPLLYSEICDFLETLINAYLKDREKEVLRLRLGIKCQEQTLQQVGEMIGVTRERVRQNEKRGKRILVSKLNRLSMHLYNEVLAIKEKVYSIGLGGFVFALIKFKRNNFAKFVTWAIFNNKDLECYLRVKNYFQRVI